jgi:hypothetical protein
VDDAKLLQKLKSKRAPVRYEACEELRVSRFLTPQAGSALMAAIHDRDRSVADAAQRALQAHLNPPATEAPPQPSTETPPRHQWFGGGIGSRSAFYLLLLPFATLPLLFLMSSLLGDGTPGPPIYVHAIGSLTPGVVLIVISRLKATDKIVASALYVLVGFPVVFLCVAVLYFLRFFMGP